MKNENECVPLDGEEFMKTLPGYMPVRLIPLLGIYLNSKVKKSKVKKWLDTGMRLFYINFDIALETQFLDYLVEFVKEKSSEGVIVIYSSIFTSASLLTSLEQLPDNVLLEQDYTRLKLRDICGKVVMLDCQKHELYDNIRIYNQQILSECPENKYWKVDTKSRPITVKQIPIPVNKESEVGENYPNIADFVKDNCETLDTCHSTRGLLVLSCIEESASTGKKKGKKQKSTAEIFIETITKDHTFVTCGAVALRLPCEDFSIPDMISLSCQRWKAMVKYLLNLIDEKFKVNLKSSNHLPPRTMISENPRILKNNYILMN